MKWRGVYWNRHGYPSVCPWTQFCPELFSYSFARTVLKFIHNGCVHMKLCMCNFDDHSIIGCKITFPWTCKFYWIIVVQRNNPTVLHVLNSKLHTMLLVVYSFACAIFILSLVAELSTLELVNLLNHCYPEHYSHIFAGIDLKFRYNVFVYMKLWIFNFHVHLSISLSVCPCLRMGINWVFRGMKWPKFVISLQVV